MPNAVHDTMSPMSESLVLLAPAANHVYAGQAGRLCAAELSLTCPNATSVAPVTVAGVEYLSIHSEDPLPPADLAAVARSSAALACFEYRGDLLAPLELPQVDVVDEDLVTIPKYRGKTNEQFTRLLLNLTLASLEGRCATRRDEGQRLAILDPLAGRGTTLECAWRAGHNGFGVEQDVKAVEALAAHVTTWLRRKHLKHSCGTHPVRRDGRSLGKRFDAEVRLPKTEPLAMGVFTGDAADSAVLWGRKTFDAVVTDAPYGVVHGSHSGASRRRSPTDLLREAIPVWAGQLRHGGALGMSWNTLGLSREHLVTILSAAGLTPLDDDLWHQFSHRVDSSIHRDLIVAVKP